MFSDVTALPTTVTISRPTWYFLCQRYSGSAQHYVLHVPFAEAGEMSADDAKVQAIKELHRQELASGPFIHRGLKMIVRLLVKPAVEIHGWITDHQRGTTGVVAAGDSLGNAILARLGKQAIYVQVIKSDQLAQAIINRLPEMPSVQGHSYKALLASLDHSSKSTATEDRSEQTWLRGNEPIGQLDAQLLAIRQLLSQPRLGGGRFYAASRDSTGRCNTSDPITYLDLSAERWTIHQELDEIGRLSIVATPVTAATLVTQLAGLLDSTRHRAA